MFDALPDGVSTPEIKVEAPDGDPHAFVERFRTAATFEGARLSTIDGLRVDWPDGWGLVRASNTTPVLVMRFDADNSAAMARIQQAFREQLLRLEPDLRAAVLTAVLSPPASALPAPAPAALGILPHRAVALHRVGQFALQFGAVRLLRQQDLLLAQQFARAGGGSSRSACAAPGFRPAPGRRPGAAGDSRLRRRLARPSRLALRVSSSSAVRSP